MDTKVPQSADYSPRRGARAGPGGGSPGRAGQPRGFPSGGLRVSDADRDTALAELSEHFQAGRLTSGELDERTGRILAARTGSELEGLLSDLPVLAPAAAPAEDRRPRPARPSAVSIVIAVAAVAVITSVLALGASHGHDNWSAGVPILVIFLIARRLARRNGR